MPVFRIVKPRSPSCCSRRGPELLPRKLISLPSAAAPSVHLLGHELVVLVLTFPRPHPARSLPQGFRLPGMRSASHPRPCAGCQHPWLSQGGVGCEMCESGRSDSDEYGIRIMATASTDAILERADIQRSYTLVIWRGRPRLRFQYARVACRPSSGFRHWLARGADLSNHLLRFPRYRARR